MASHSIRSLPPSHPGVFLREDVLPYLDVSKAEFAKLLAIDEAQLQDILEEREGLNTRIAVRLGKALGNGARFWLTLQIQYDIWKDERELKDDIPQLISKRKLSHI